MLKWIARYILFVIFLIVPQLGFASDLFKITSTGASANIEATICLNAKAQLSCQNYKISSLMLNILTTIPNHVYPFAGIKLITTGYQPQNCTLISNGFCLFSANDLSPVAIPLEPLPARYTIGGTVAGLIGSVTLQNNGADSTIINSNGLFAFNTAIPEGGSYHVTVQTQPAAQTCTVANGSGTNVNADVSTISVNCVTNIATISVPANNSIPVGSGVGTITVTNTSSTYPAINVHAELPTGWTAVTQNASACSVIQPNGTCTLSFTTTTPYIAEGGIAITGDNVTSPPTTAIAFTLNGYFVFAVDSASTASVVDSVVQSSQQWGNSVITNAQSFINGFSNTSLINSTAGIGSSAAVTCYNSTNGGAAVGTWYLPAICQMGGVGQGAGCSAGSGTLDTLYQLGFGVMSTGVYYWSSTENSSNPSNDAWHQLFEPGGSVQGFDFKFIQFHPLCVRDVSY